ncbi:MAG: DUF1186 family protein [Bacteroides sp.]|nr:DUF1186 family protein [Bacteroides sp.]
MAKKKNKGKSQQKVQISPERFMRDKVRKLPIGKCYISSGWEEGGIATIIVTRVRPDGNLVVGQFLVDTFCLGVKAASYHINVADYRLKEQLREADFMKETSYDEVHNIIFGAISFAEEGGIKPAKNFGIAGYILEEDTDDIPLIEYEFGKNGKHLLIVTDNGTEQQYINTLRQNLGDDFNYILPSDSEFLERAMENLKKTKAEMDRHPKEVYSYNYPSYPETLTVKNQFIADAFLSEDNSYVLPNDVIDRILALPADEAAEDIHNIVMYVIGKTYQAINDNEETIEETGSAIVHSLVMLTQLKSGKGLDTVLEIMRQTGEFADFHLGDYAPDLLPPALYVCGQNNVDAIEAYMYEPGLDSYMRSNAPDALAMIAIRNPERRGEIIEIFRRLLKSMVTRLPKQEGCDGQFAGFLMSNLMDIKATELVPEIKDVFATDCVDKTAAGDCEKVIGGMTRGPISDTKYAIPDVYEFYESRK